VDDTLQRLEAKGPEPRANGIARLESMRAFEEPALGIAERFLTPTLGGGKTVAILSTPIGREPAAGWVLCHSYGLEQINLYALEVPLARTIAAAGNAVLRFHAQGYGDSAIPHEEVSLASHLSSAIDAVDVIRTEAGISEVGLFGARFGGAVAATAADRLAQDGVGISALALWEPMVRGRSYMQALARMSVLSELISSGRESGTARDPAEILRESGVLDVQGFPLRQETFEEVSAVDLLQELRVFQGRSLVVQVSKGERVRPDLQRLMEHLQGLGGDATLEVVTDPKADRFGRPRYRGMANGTKADTQQSVADAIISMTATWCAGALPQGGGP
jgi:pimeloyl-ACP methyl ester carboxylesterase